MTQLFEDIRERVDEFGVSPGDAAGFRDDVIELLSAVDALMEVGRAAKLEFDRNTGLLGLRDAYNALPPELKEALK